MLATKQTDVRKLNLEALTKHLQLLGEAPFRAKQIYHWLWAKSVRDFDKMCNLSLNCRKKLKEHFSIYPVNILEARRSADKTIKYAFELYDKNIVEGVLIPAGDRSTACISSQVGCSLTCKFCATGYMERKRNLEAAEIYDQVVLINQESCKNFNRSLSNIVYMGMGEPLLNYKEVLRSIDRITAPDGLGISAARVTLSTAGIAKMIKQLGDDQVRFNLALSLHAANDEKRSALMPINEQNSLKALSEALKYYFAKTKNPVTYEYIVFHGVNDQLQDAKELAQFCKHLPCKVNIIEYNSIEWASFQNAQEEKIEAFANYLKSQGINTHIRRSRGKDVDAACGQLAIKSSSPKHEHDRAFFK